MPIGILQADPFLSGTLEPLFETLLKELLIPQCGCGYTGILPAYTLGRQIFPEGAILCMTSDLSNVKVVLAPLNQTLNPNHS